MIDILVADTCSFVNFAVVHRVDLLQDLYDGRITCAEAVHREVIDLTATMPEVTSLFASSWFDHPITFTEPGDIAAIERLRRTVLGGRVGLPRQHLGEAQSIHAVTTIPSLRGAVLITDDRTAADHARRLGVPVLDSTDVLSEAYEQDLVGCPEAYDVLVAMRAERRGVRVPDSHYGVCPPAG